MYFLLFLIFIFAGLALWMWKRQDPVKRDQQNYAQEDFLVEQMDAQLAKAVHLLEDKSVQDYEQAYQSFLSLAKQYDLPEAYLYMSQMQLKGLGRPQDSDAAVGLLEKAFHLGERSAALQLAKLYESEQYKLKNNDKALYWYQHAAAYGNLDAQYVLAHKYAYGQDVTQDEEKAFNILSRAAEQGHATSQYALGQVYANGHYQQEKNMTQARQWWLQAASQGHVEANQQLIHAYTQGIGVQKDLVKVMHFIAQLAYQGDEKSLYPYFLTTLKGLNPTHQAIETAQYLKQQATQQDVLAQSLLGTAYFSGLGLQQDQRAAFHAWSSAAQAGDLNALCQIAMLYQTGKVVEKNQQKAVELYQHAVDAGSAVGQVCLAECYLHGQGVTQNPQQAQHLLQMGLKQWYNGPLQNKSDILYALGCFYSLDFIAVTSEAKAKAYLELAAQYGAVEAKYKLATLYLCGLGGFMQDPLQTAFWAQQATTEGHLFAQTLLGQLYVRGSGVAQDYEQALMYLQRATEQGHSVAMSALGEMYENGWGISENIEQAVQLYRQAIEIDEDAVACYHLGKLYARGKGSIIIRDVHLAKVWLHKARIQGNEKAQKLYDALEDDYI